MIEIAERNTQRMEYMWRVRERPEFYESPSPPPPLSLSLTQSVTHADTLSLHFFLSLSVFSGVFVCTVSPCDVING